MTTETALLKAVAELGAAVLRAEAERNKALGQLEEATTLIDALTSELAALQDAAAETETEQEDEMVDGVGPPKTNGAAPNMATARQVVLGG